MDITHENLYHTKTIHLFIYFQYLLKIQLASFSFYFLVNSNFRQEELVSNLIWFAVVNGMVLKVYSFKLLNPCIS